MSRPPKPAAVIKAEGKSHRTKAEVDAREEAEKKLKSGMVLRELPEVKKNKTAHKEFLRVRKLMQIIEKDDDLFTAVINRYCLMCAECHEFQKLKDDMMELIEQEKSNFEALKFRSAKEQASEMTKFIGKLNSLLKNILSISVEIKSVRKMMFDIEKEMAMTVAAALRAIPKKPDEKSNPLLEALKDDDEEEDEQVVPKDT